MFFIIEICWCWCSRHFSAALQTFTGGIEPGRLPLPSITYWKYTPHYLGHAGVLHCAQIRMTTRQRWTLDPIDHLCTQSGLCLFIVKQHILYFLILLQHQTHHLLLDTYDVLVDPQTFEAILS